MGLLNKAQGDLAINGGQKARTEPWPERGHLGNEEKAAVDALFDQAIETGRMFGYNGEPEEDYCSQFAAFMGGGFADAVNSGTSAVYVALRALEPAPFSEVIAGPITDPGGVMPIPLMNCIPVISDSAPGTYAPGAEQIEACITPRTSAIIVAHIFGEPADMVSIMALARRHGIPVIEDCAQAHCARLHGNLLGTYGDIAAFSTMFGKHHNTGGQGGVVFTRDRELAWKSRRYSDRGKPFGLEGDRSNVAASMNLNLNDLAAAIGSVQLKKLPGIVGRRRKFVEKVSSELSRLSTVCVPRQAPGAEPSYWFWRLEVREENLSVDKDTYCRALEAEGVKFMASYGHFPQSQEWYRNRMVFGRPGYPWTSPEYKGDPDRTFPCPNAHAAVERCINLTLHESWGDEEAADLVTAFTKLERAYAKAGR